MCFCASIFVVVSLGFLCMFGYFDTLTDQIHNKAFLHFTNFSFLWISHFLSSGLIFYWFKLVHYICLEYMLNCYENLKPFLASKFYGQKRNLQNLYFLYPFADPLSSWHSVGFTLEIIPIWEYEFLSTDGRSEFGTSNPYHGSGIMITERRNWASPFIWWWMMSTSSYNLIWYNVIWYDIKLSV